MRLAMRNKATTVVLVLGMVLATTGAGCDKALRQAAVFMRDFSVSLQAFQQGEIQAYNLGYVSGGDHYAIQDGCEKLALYGKEANTAILTIKSKPDALTAVGKGIDQVDSMLNKNLLGVKNPDSKNGLTALLLAVRGVLISAKAALQ